MFKNTPMYPIFRARHHGSLCDPWRHQNGGNANAKTVKVTLSEWKVRLSPDKIPAGPVEFEVSNTGSIPHALEVEGRSLERKTAQIQPGATATLQLDLPAGRYEAYCPVGKGSHKMLGMLDHLTVGDAQRVRR